MKKKAFNHLQLKKSIISNLQKSAVKGGTLFTIPETIDPSVQFTGEGCVSETSGYFCYTGCETNCQGGNNAI